jgi:hypothetical protein
VTLNGKGKHHNGLHASSPRALTLLAAAHCAARCAHAGRTWFSFVLLRALRPLKTPLFRGPHMLPLFDWYMRVTQLVLRTRAFPVGEHYRHSALATPYLTVSLLLPTDPLAKGKDGVSLYTFHLWVDKDGKPLQVRTAAPNTVSGYFACCIFARACCIHEHGWAQT